MSAFAIGPAGNRKRWRFNASAPAGIVVGVRSGRPTGRVGFQAVFPQRPIADARSRTHARDLLTASRKGLPSLNAGTREAAMSIARARVASAAGISRVGAERAEAGDGNGFVPCKGIADGGEHRRDHSVGLGLGEREIRSEVRRELGVVQVCFSLLGVQERPWSMCGWLSSLFRLRHGRAKGRAAA